MQTRKEKTRMNKRMTSSLSLLMCGVLLSTSILPTATVFAETTTPTTDSSTPVPTDGMLNTDLTDTSKVPDFQTPTLPSTDTPEETVLTTTRMGSTKQPIQTEETQPATILTGKWGTAPVSFDTETGVLTVSDGQLNNPFDLGNNRIDNIYLRDIKKIVLDGHVKAPENSRFLFYSDEYLETNFKNLTSIEGDLDTSIVTNMRYMFSSKSLLNVDVSKFNTSNVTDTDSMFQGSKIKELDVSTWDTSNVTNTDSMFQGSEVEYLDVSKWNTSALINMGRIFADTQIKELDVSKWNTSNVTDMLGTFFRSNLTKLDISSWDTSNVENTASMFQDTQISYLDLSNFDSSKLITVDNMFSNSTFKTIKFGSKSIFNQGKDNGGKVEGKVFLPHIDTSTGEYTGRWERIDPKSPPSVYESSNDFTDRYDGSQPGTYTWQRATVKAQDLTVFYQDTNGNGISKSKTVSGNVGDTFKESPIDIKGYTFKEVKDNTPTEGTLSDEEQSITFVYNKIAQDLTVFYQDTNGNGISKSKTVSGNVGDTFKESPIDIKGYTFKEVKDNTPTEGTLSDEEQSITFVYNKNSTDPSKDKNDGKAISSGNGNIQQTKSLPKTGEEVSSTITFSGITALLLASCVWLAKRRQNKKQ